MICLINYAENPYLKIFQKENWIPLWENAAVINFPGGRGSGIGFVHKKTMRILQFDEPHPGNELYNYQIKKTIQFLKDIGELK